MAVALGSRRSSLNPNAPLFIPAAFQQVEDFSPEWWELVKTSTWFRDHWFHQHQEQETFDGDEDDEDIASLLPESFDLGINDEFSSPEGLLDAAVYNQLSGAGADSGYPLRSEKQKYGFGQDVEALIKNVSMKSMEKGVRSSMEQTKYFEKPVSPKPKLSPRRIIQQPR